MHSTRSILYDCSRMSYYLLVQAPSETSAHTAKIIVKGISRTPPFFEGWPVQSLCCDSDLVILD